MKIYTRKTTKTIVADDYNCWGSDVVYDLWEAFADGLTPTSRKYGTEKEAVAALLLDNAATLGFVTGAG